MHVVISSLQLASCCRYHTNGDIVAAKVAAPSLTCQTQVSNCLALEQPSDTLRQREERLHWVEQMGYALHIFSLLHVYK